MTAHFWDALPKPYFILAPMEDVTDVVFRHVIARAARPDVFFTEFTNSDSWNSPHGNHSTKGRLAFTDDERPIVAHIWGDNPEHFAAMSSGMANAGFQGIDINMGCPAPNVAPKGKGSGLIRRPDVAGEIIQATKAGGLPVSVKTRLGYTRPDEMAQWIPFLLQQDIANLTIHLRSKKEMSKVPAHYEYISKIVAMRDSIAPHTKITINGDISSRQHGNELIAQNPGVDGIMIGRGVFHNPFAFEAHPTNHSQQELYELLLYHLDLFDMYHSVTHRPYATLKRYYKIYISGFDGAAELRNQLMQSNSTDEARQIITASQNYE